MRNLIIPFMVFFLLFAGCSTDRQDGVDGEDGAIGVDGANGVTGNDGANGEDGTDGTNGTKGIDGEDGEKGEDGKIPFGLDLIKPENNRTFATTSYATYTLAEDVQTITFIRTKVSGSGPETDSVVLTGEDAVAGYHEFVEITGAELTEGDIYNLAIEALTFDGDIVQLTPVFNLLVDNEGPQLIEAKAIQTIFGTWSVGDHLVFTFSETVDGDNLWSLEDIETNLSDQSVFGYDYFSDATFSWSTDFKVLTLTIQSEVSGNILVADTQDSSENALFNPASVVRDYAGNSDKTVTDIKLISTGDITPPFAVIKDPSSNTSIPLSPVIELELSEKLSEGKLVITSQFGKNVDTLPKREWVLDDDRKIKGIHLIDFSAEGIEPLFDGALYIFTFEGKDEAGNNTFYELSSVLADGTPTLSPGPGSFYVRNYSHELVQEPGTRGLACSVLLYDVSTPILFDCPEVGDYIRVYADGELVGQAPFQDFGYMGGSNPIEHTVISGLPTIEAGALIEYSFLDEAGNESELVSNGTMPGAPDSLEISKLGIRAGVNKYEVGSTGTLTADHELFVNIDMDPDQIIYTGWTDGGGVFSKATNAIPTDKISYGSEIYYVHQGHHFSDYSPSDGTMQKIVSVEIIDDDFNGRVSNHDVVEVTASANVDTGLDTDIFSYGSCEATVGNYTWAPDQKDFNIAPVSTGTALSFDNPDFSFKYSSSDHFRFEIEMIFDSFPSGNAKQIGFEIHPLCANSVLSSDGGHCLLPSSTITPNGTLGGLISPPVL